MHGRVNQQQLAEAMLGAGVWFYPTWFSETSCITAMEAQAAGLRIVCPPIAALAETAPASVRYWTGAAAFDCITAMRDTSGRFAGKGKEFSLDTLAQDWQTRLNKLVADARANVVPAFVEAAQ